MNSAQARVLQYVEERSNCWAILLEKVSQSPLLEEGDLDVALDLIAKGMLKRATEYPNAVRISPDGQAALKRYNGQD